MGFDVAKCMERSPEQIKVDVALVNRCINPLGLYSTEELVAELKCRTEVKYGVIPKDQYAYHLGDADIDDLPITGPTVILIYKEPR